MSRYEFEVDSSKSLLNGKISGVWNLDEARNYTDDFEKVIKSFHGEWKNLINLKEWQVSMPEVIPIIAGNLSWASKKGMRKTAFLAGSPVVEQQLDMLIRRSGLNGSGKVFRDEKEALDWLQS